MPSISKFKNRAFPGTARHYTCLGGQCQGSPRSEAEWEGGCGAGERVTVISERGTMIANLATYADIINKAWNSHDGETVLSFYSPNYVGSDVGQPALQRGHQGLRNMLEMYWKAFPDLQFMITDRVIESSRVAVVWVAEGTHPGTIMNIPPTGHKVEVRGVSIIDVKDSRIVSGQYIWDLAGMLRHMGLLPELQTIART